MTDSPSARSVRVDAIVPGHVEALFDARPDLMCTAPGGVTILKYHIQSFNPKLEVVDNTRGTAACPRGEDPRSTQHPEETRRITGPDYICSHQNVRRTEFSG